MRSNEQHDNNHGSRLSTLVRQVLFTLQSNPYKSQSHMLEEFTNWDLRAQAIALETIGPIRRARSLKDILSFGMVTGGRFGKDCGGDDDDLFGGDSDGHCPCCPNMVALKVTRRFRGSGRSQIQAASHSNHMSLCKITIIFFFALLFLTAIEIWTTTTAREKESTTKNIINAGFGDIFASHRERPGRDVICIISILVWNGEDGYKGNRSCLGLDDFECLNHAP
ncbi:hypothetical protein Ancab_010893 [Ancistrocladus abbreviatus]